MVYKIADNITSPLGDTTEANYQAVLSGQSVIRTYTDHWDVPEPFAASLFTVEQEKDMAIEGLTRFEAMVVKSVRKAMQQKSVDLTGSRVVFILSTTKANVGSSSENLPGESARRIARKVGIQTEPIVVCNACISGLSALILGKRLLETDRYDYAVVCGADCQSKFIISGFQSLKALSAQPCRPFDMERLGLNLGEAAATMILTNDKGLKTKDENLWALRAGVIRNDAYHISSPSRNGDGCYNALKTVLRDVDTRELAFVNAHGTATMFNDQMESVALERAGLTEVPVNALKGYYGHTMGAAGVLETILCMRGLENQQIIGTRGFEELGVSGNIQVAAENRHLPDKTRFVKILSGFGGCNAALLVEKTKAEGERTKAERQKILSLHTTHRVKLTPHEVVVDGKNLSFTGEGKEMLTDVYKQYIGDYPKFYKMDMLGRLGFVASELLLKTEHENLNVNFNSENRAVVLFNRSSSLNADKRYEESIQDKDNYFPSPSLFVYTLPNIVTGEIAIRNHYMGETSFYVLPKRDQTRMNEIIETAFLDPATTSILTGWLDDEDEEHFEVELEIREIK